MSPYFRARFSPPTFQWGAKARLGRKFIESYGKVIATLGGRVDLAAFNSVPALLPRSPRPNPPCTLFSRGRQEISRYPPARSSPRTKRKGNPVGGEG